MNLVNKVALSYLTLIKTNKNLPSVFKVHQGQAYPSGKVVLEDKQVIYRVQVSGAYRRMSNNTWEIQAESSLIE